MSSSITLLLIIHLYRDNYIYIMQLRQIALAAKLPKTLYFYRDITFTIAKHCTSCHWKCLVCQQLYKTFPVTARAIFCPSPSAVHTFNHISFCSLFYPFIITIVSNCIVNPIFPRLLSEVIPGHSVFTLLLNIASLPNHSHWQKLNDKRLGFL